MPKSRLTGISSKILLWIVIFLIWIILIGRCLIFHGKTLVELKTKWIFSFALNSLAGRESGAVQSAVNDLFCTVFYQHVSRGRKRDGETWDRTRFRGRWYRFPNGWLHAGLATHIYAPACKDATYTRISHNEISGYLLAKGSESTGQKRRLCTAWKTGVALYIKFFHRLSDLSTVIIFFCMRKAKFSVDPFLLFWKIIATDCNFFYLFSASQARRSRFPYIPEGFPHVNLHNSMSFVTLYHFVTRLNKFLSYRSLFVFPKISSVPFPIFPPWFAFARPPQAVPTAELKKKNVSPAFDILFYFFIRETSKFPIFLKKNCFKFII